MHLFVQRTDMLKKTFYVIIVLGNYCVMNGSDGSSEAASLTKEELQREAALPMPRNTKCSNNRVLTRAQAAVQVRSMCDALNAAWSGLLSNEEYFVDVMTNTRDESCFGQKVQPEYLLLRN